VQSRQSHHKVKRHNTKAADLLSLTSTCTMTGSVSGRPLVLKMLSTAASSSAFAPRPYTARRKTQAGSPHHGILDSHTLSPYGLQMSKVLHATGGRSPRRRWSLPNRRAAFVGPLPCRAYLSRWGMPRAPPRVVVPPPPLVPWASSPASEPFAPCEAKSGRISA
jgi:hypothetical protein